MPYSVLISFGMIATLKCIFVGNDLCVVRYAAMVTWFSLFVSDDKGNENDDDDDGVGFGMRMMTIKMMMMVTW